MSGLEVLRRIRAAGSTVDVIVVTRARDLSVVQAAVSFGAMQYLVKPFTFAAVRQKLERYQAYRSMLAENNLLLAQQEVDRLMHTLRDTAADDLPKGISSESLQAVVAALRESRGAPAACPRPRWRRTSGSSRVTARRYLEYLVTSGRRGAQRALPQRRPPRGGVPAGPRDHHGHPAALSRDHDASGGTTARAEALRRSCRCQPSRGTAGQGPGDDGCAVPRPDTAACSPGRLEPGHPAVRDPGAGRSWWC